MVLMYVRQNVTFKRFEKMFLLSRIKTKQGSYVENSKAFDSQKGNQSHRKCKSTTWGSVASWHGICQSHQLAERNIDKVLGRFSALINKGPSINFIVSR